MNLTLASATFASELRIEHVPSDIVFKAQQALRDHCACVLAGSQTDVGSLVWQALAADCSGPVRILGTGATTSPALAAYCNATFANAMDFDDTSSAGHPGASVIAAALSAAAVQPCSGARFLSGVIAGYEVGMRVAEAIRPSWERYRQVHGIGTAQVFGAAAAAASILDLPPRQIAIAFGIAGSQAPVPHAGKFGWEERPLTWLKDNVAWPAEVGLRAALLAQAGFPATPSILDGDRGFWAMAGSDRFDPRCLSDYSTFLLSRLAFKPYPCCRWIHTTLDALSLLQRQHLIDRSHIHQIRLKTIQPLVDQFMDAAPRTMVDAQFSLPHAVAMQFLHVPVQSWWLPEYRLAERIRQIMASVVAEHSPACTERYLAMGQQNGCVPVHIELLLTTGERYAAYEEVARGESVRPLSDDELVDKFMALTIPLLGEPQVARLLDRLADLVAAKSLDPLLDLLAPQPI